MKEQKGGKKKNLRAAPAVFMPGKVIRTTSGNIVKQYPPKITYHGTAREENLNPEE